jgi:hypothetical protein
MTNNHTSTPDDNHDRGQADRLRPDQLRCPCGAIADGDGRCRKCRARAAWACRTAGRRRFDGQVAHDRGPRRAHVRKRTEPLIRHCCRRPRPDEGIEL